MRKVGSLSIIVILALLISACGGGGEAPVPASEANGDVAAGQALFNQTMIDGQAGCVLCHSLEPDEVVVGPSMAGLATRAGSTVEGLSAEEYIRQSILEPNAHVVEGYPANVMVQVWEDSLSQQELDNLVAFLLTLQ